MNIFGQIEDGIENFLLAALPHYITASAVSTLPANMTVGGLGKYAFFGSQNTVKDVTVLNDHTTGVIMGEQSHYRTGDYVDATNLVQIGKNVSVDVTLKAGIQDGTHNEQGIRTDRAAASTDLFLYSPNGFHDGQFSEDVAGPNGQALHLTLQHSGANFFFGTSTGVPVQGLTLSLDGKSLEDSFNISFAHFQHGPAGTGDVLPGNYSVALTEYVDAPLLGHVPVASVTTHLHLV
jgi:hypothetical protein